MLPLIRRTKALANRSRHQTLTSSTSSTQKRSQSFQSSAGRMTSDRKSPYEIIDKTPDMEQKRVAFGLKEIPRSVGDKAGHLNATLKTEQVPHPVVRSPRYQQERMVAPLPHAGV